MSGVSASIHALLGIVVVAVWKPPGQSSTQAILEAIDVSCKQRMSCTCLGRQNCLLPRGLSKRRRPPPPPLLRHPPPFRLPCCRFARSMTFPIVSSFCISTVETQTTTTRPKSVINSFILLNKRYARGINLMYRVHSEALDHGAAC